MKILIQRVQQASVSVGGETIGQIGQGLLALCAIEPDDSAQILSRMATKLLGYRVFSDDAGRMNCSVADIEGGLLLVSQFTLAANTRKGLRPSFTSAAKPADAQRLFDQFVNIVRTQHADVQTGQFGADMQVSLVNDGPVTFMLES